MMRQQALDFAAAWETRFVAAFALLLLAANLALAHCFPVWGDDDVLLLDAGVNWSLGCGFISTAWPGQASTEFFSGNLPLYPLCIGVWLKLFGFGYLQLRAFSYVCGSVAALVLHAALRRLGWIHAATTRIACVVVTLLAAPVFMAYRRCRYDMFQLLLCTLLLAVWASSGRPRMKLAALGLLGALVVAAGFQTALYVGILCGVAICWEGRAAWPKAAAIVAGLGLGAAAVFAIYWQQSAWHGLFENLAWGRRLDGSTAESLQLARLHRLVYEPLRDMGMLPMCAALLVPVTQFRPGENRPLWRTSLAALGLALGLMLVLEFAIHYARYYRWMVFLPLALAAFAVYDRFGPALARWRRRAMGACLATAAAFGFPALMGATILLLPYAGESHALQEIARRELRPGDVVFSEYQAYTAVKTRCAEVYFPGYLERMTPAETARVNVLILREAHGPGYYTVTNGEYLDRFSQQGQRWQKVAEVPHLRTPLTAWLARHFPAAVARRELNSNLYEQSFFRRVDSSAE